MNEENEIVDKKIKTKKKQTKVIDYLKEYILKTKLLNNIGFKLLKDIKIKNDVIKLNNKIKRFNNKKYNKINTYKLLNILNIKNNKYKKYYLKFKKN